MRDAVIFDVDGTLVDVSGIRHLVTGTPNARDFDAFHWLSAGCPAHDWVTQAARDAHDGGLAVLVVTARRAKFRHVTAWWLALNQVPSDALFMRGDRDGRPDAAVKADILTRIRTQFRVVHAFDDNPTVIGVWRDHGIPVTVVPGWDDTPPPAASDPAGRRREGALV